MSYLLDGTGSPDGRQQFVNALKDPRVEFALVPSARLRELIAQWQHPAITKLPQEHAYALMTCPDGKCIPVGRALVIRYVEGKCEPDEKFVLDLCDVRFWQSANVVATGRDKPAERDPDAPVEPKRLQKGPGWDILERMGLDPVTLLPKRRS